MIELFKKCVVCGRRYIFANTNLWGLKYIRMLHIKVTKDTCPMCTERAYAEEAHRVYNRVTNDGDRKSQYIMERERYPLD